MNIRIYVVSFIVMLCAPVILFAQQVDYSVVSVQEESGTEFTKITTVGDYVCMPIVNRSGSSINWLSNRILDISYEGTHIAYLSCRNNTVNIFIKDLSRQGGSVQRTNRTAIGDFLILPMANISVSQSSEEMKIRFFRLHQIMVMYVGR